MRAWVSSVTRPSSRASVAIDARSSAAPTLSPKMSFRSAIRVRAARPGAVCGPVISSASANGSASPSAGSWATDALARSASAREAVGTSGSASTSLASSAPRDGLPHDEYSCASVAVAAARAVLGGHSVTSCSTRAMPSAHRPRCSYQYPTAAATAAAGSRSGCGRPRAARTSGMSASTSSTKESSDSSLSPDIRAANHRNRRREISASSAGSNERDAKARTVSSSRTRSGGPSSTTSRERSIRPCSHIAARGSSLHTSTAAAGRQRPRSTDNRVSRSRASGLSCSTDHATVASSVRCRGSAVR